MIKKSSSKKKQPLVEVIVLTYNGKENLVNCMKTLGKTRYSNLKITIVDNGSASDYAKFIKDNYSSVNIIRCENNKSFSEANNTALKKSKAKYCILLNDDTIQHPDWIEELVKIAEADYKIGALQPKILSLRDKKMFEYAGAGGGFIDIYGYPICRGRVFDNIERDIGQYNDKRETFWASGCSIFLNMDACHKIGYLDETFGSYCEEIDLCWRMHIGGYKIEVVPKSVIYHFGSAIWGKKNFKFKKEYLLHRNHWIILFKNYSRREWPRIMPMKIALEILTFFGFLFINPVKSAAILKANLWILLNLGILAGKNREISKMRIAPDISIKKNMVDASVALHYFLFRDKKMFRDFIPYIKGY